MSLPKGTLGIHFHSWQTLIPSFKHKTSSWLRPLKTLVLTSLPSCNSAPLLHNPWKTGRDSTGHKETLGLSSPRFMSPSQITEDNTICFVQNSDHSFDLHLRRWTIMHVLPHNAPQALWSSTTNCLFNNKLESKKTHLSYTSLLGKKLKAQILRNIGQSPLHFHNSFLYKTWEFKYFNWKKNHQWTQKTPQTKWKPKSQNQKTKPNPKTLGGKKNCLINFLHKQLFREQQRPISYWTGGWQDIGWQRGYPALNTVQTGRPRLQKCLGRLFGWVSYSCAFKLAPQSPTPPNTPVQVTSPAKPKTEPQKVTGWNVDSRPHPFSRHCGCNAHGKLKPMVSLGWQRQCMQSLDLAFNAGRFAQPPAVSETKRASIVSQPWGEAKHYLFWLTQNNKKKVLKWWEYLPLP